MTWIMSLLLALSTAQEPQRAPVPEAAAQRDAEKFFKDLLKDEYKGRSEAEKRILSQKLYAQALDLKDNPARQFVALRQSYDVALQGGAFDRAETAVQAMQERFLAPVAALRLAILAAKAKISSETKALAVDHLQLAADAADEEDFDTSAKAAKGAVDFARKAKEAGLMGKADAFSKEVAERKAKFEVVRRAKDVLKASPGDAAANLIVGRHEALVKGAWEVGLPLLEKSSDATLKQLAQWDLAGPSRVEDQLAVADGWWGVGEPQAQRRAAFWYAKARAAAPAEAKGRIEERLKAIGGTAALAVGPFKLDEDGAIENWLLLGPFTHAYEKAIGADVLGGEKTAAPAAGASVGALTWTAHAVAGGHVVLAQAMSAGIWAWQMDPVGYAACWIEAESDMTVMLRLGADDGYKVWLGGEEVGARSFLRGFSWDMATHEVKLKKGRQLLLFKACSKGGGFAFGVRLTTKGFEVPKGVRIWN